MFEVEDIFQSLKELRKGEGLTVSKLHEADGFAEIFGDGSAAKAFENLRSVADQLNESPSVIAARNALAIGVPVRRNATARRVALLLEQDEVFGTERNLLRIEDKGLRELAVALYSQQPGSLDVDEETPDSLGASDGSTEDNADDEGVWEILLLMAKRIAKLEKLNDFLFVTRSVNEDVESDEQFRLAQLEWVRTVRESPDDHTAIIEKLEAATQEAIRAERQSRPPIPIIGDSIEITDPFES